jgi:hypothetical protein
MPEAGLASGVVEQPGDQRGLKVHPEVAGRALDDHLQAVLAERLEVDPGDPAAPVQSTAGCP